MSDWQILAARLRAAPAALLIGGVKAYRLLFSAWIGNVCRYEPSCSTYALQALQRHGAVRGTMLSGWRVLRCNPWCLGGHDPVPEPGSPGAGLFTRLGLKPGDDLSNPTRNRP